MDIESVLPLQAGIRAIGPEPPNAQKANRVLRGEWSAIEAYGQALISLTWPPDRYILSRIRAEHELSARALSLIVTHQGGLPDGDAGLWGVVVRTLVGARKPFGRSAILEILRRGEEFGLRLYRALEIENFGRTDLRLIRWELIPRQERHLAQLEELTKLH